MSEASGADEMICACIGMRSSDLQGQLSENPALSFEALMQRTGAGGRCTACLLDLEYYFTTLPRSGLSQRADTKEQTKRKPGIKSRLFGFLDRISPLRAISLQERMPILIAPDVEEYLWIVNRPMLERPESCAPPTDVYMTIRGPDGAIRHREVVCLQEDGQLRMELTGYFSAEKRKNELTIGSIDIERRARKVGIRGTTRPQLELLTRNGSCSVHTQRPGLQQENWLTVLCRPEEERLFISVVNPTDRVLNVSFDYPFFSDAPAIPLHTHQDEIAPQGAALHELKLPREVRLHNRPCAVRWRLDGASKAHLFCATPALDRFSMDHL